MHEDGHCLEKLDRIAKKIASRKNRIVMKTYRQQQDKLYRNENLLSAAGQIVW